MIVNACLSAQLHSRILYVSTDILELSDNIVVI